MLDLHKTEQELIDELLEMGGRVAELEAREAGAVTSDDKMVEQARKQSCSFLKH